MTRDLPALCLVAAQAAAEAIRCVRSDALNVTSKSGIEDFVTAADHAAEAAIISTIRAARPDDTLIAEETGTLPGTSGTTWYIDPIDGTANFIADNPNYAVSIAAHTKGQAVAAIIYRPATDTWLAAGTDGITGNLSPHLGAPRVLSQCKITVCRPHDPDHRRSAMALRRQLVPHVGSETRIGSAACALLSVVTGDLDAYLSVDLPTWDTAAGHHLVGQAGGTVLTTPSPTGGTVSIAANRDTAAQIVDLLQLDPP